MTLPSLSLTTSNSISFQPAMPRSMSTCVMGDSARPFLAISWSCSGSFAIPPPVPPSVKAGLTITGYPISSAKARASSTSVTTLEGMQGWPMDSIVSLKLWRSSALSMHSGEEPRSFTPCEARKPSLASCMHSVSAVCPPRPERMESGFSVSMILLIVVSVNGSMYILSAMDLSVMIVAGLELTRTISMPSSLKALHACVPA